MYSLLALKPEIHYVRINERKSELAQRKFSYTTLKLTLGLGLQYELEFGYCQFGLLADFGLY